MAREIVLPPSEGPADYRSGSILFIGNATVLLRFAGFTVLTDPNFLHKGDRASLGYGLLHARRLTDPAIELADLPKVDFVLLSHHHEDHFDRLVARDLDHQLPILTTPQAARKLRKKGFAATIPVKKWGQVTFAKGDARLRITAMPGRHGPPLISRLLPQVMGGMLEFEAPERGVILRLYVSGDTLVSGAMRRIPKLYPDVDLGLFHLGGTRVLGLLLTMDAMQGVEAIRIVDPHTALPIHFDDYDIFRSSLGDFQREAQAAGISDRVRYLLRGELLGFEVPEGERWRPLVPGRPAQPPAPQPPGP